MLTNHSPSPRCGKCAGENIVKNGRNSSGNPRYLCRDCGACRVFRSTKLKLTPERSALIAKAYQERNSLRSVARIFDVSHVTIWKYLKKKAQSLADFKTTIAPAQANDTLELDEIFTFYAIKINHIRIWIALNRRNRQIVAFHIGDGSQASCQRFYRKLPYEYYQKHCFADLWKSYACLPKTKITQVGKETGLTNHVERLNNTIRQRFSRMVRKTLSFSKRLYMLHLHFKLWAFYYNQACVLKYESAVA